MAPKKAAPAMKKAAKKAAAPPTAAAPAEPATKAAMKAAKKAVTYQHFSVFVVFQKSTFVGIGFPKYFGPGNMLT